MGGRKAGCRGRGRVGQRAARPSYGRSPAHQPARPARRPQTRPGLPARGVRWTLLSGACLVCALPGRASLAQGPSRRRMLARLWSDRASQALWAVAGGNAAWNLHLGKKVWPFLPKVDKFLP